MPLKKVGLPALGKTTNSRGVQLFARQVRRIAQSYPLVFVITATSLVGSVGGAVLGRRLSPRGLRRGFAWLVIAMGLFMFAKELPAVVASGAVAVTLLAVFVVARRFPPRPPSIPTELDSMSPSPSRHQRA